MLDINGRRENPGSRVPFSKSATSRSLSDPVEPLAREPKIKAASMAGSREQSAHILSVISGILASFILSHPS
jgi:hypothetical protein